MKRGVVIVGSGLIARFHAQAVKASGRLELRGFCNPHSPAHAQEIAAEFGGEAWGDLDAALSAAGVGMATVATASGAHDEAVFAAAKRGVPALVEKPLSITVARVDAMIAACKAAGVPLGCIFQTRWNEEFLSARRRIASGELGRITYAAVRVPWWRADEYYTQSSWHGTWAVDGGGAAINQAIHMIDWLVALMPEVEDVKAFASTLAHPMEAEDTVSAVVRFRGGALGGVYAATSSFPGRGKTMEITGTKGTLEIKDEAHGSSRPDQLPYDGHLKCLEAFAESLDGGRPYPIPGVEARKSVDLVERIYKSAGIRRMQMSLLAGVACMAANLLAADLPSVDYLSPVFDGSDNLTGMETRQCTEYKPLDQSGDSLGDGWYVLSTSVGIPNLTNGLTVWGDAHLILCNGQSLESDQSAGSLPGILVKPNASLTIYAQSPDKTVMGRVIACGALSCAGIQGEPGSHMTINGGLILATGGTGAAGIGGTKGQIGESITINGGFVEVCAGLQAACIGGGYAGDARFIRINGGTIDDTSGQGTSGIGPGSGGSSHDIVFAGGCITRGTNAGATDADGNPVTMVNLPDMASRQSDADMFDGLCSLWFKGVCGYYARDVYPLDAGHLFLYLPDGDYEVSVLDGSRAVKRYRIVIQGGVAKIERIYDYVTFESTTGFSLGTANQGKNWDADLFCSTDLLKWYEWDGQSINAAFSADFSSHRLYVRGTANTYLCRTVSEFWVLSPNSSGARIACLGNFETLRGGAEEDPAPAAMAANCCKYLFLGCGALSCTPVLPATNLTTGCYASMFLNCTSLVEPPKLPAVDLPARCYESMFRGCSGILLNQYRKGRVWMIPPEAKGDADWNAGMFADTGYFFMGDPDIGKEYYISLLTLVNPADPPRYASEDAATNGVATSFVIWPNDDVKAAQPDPYAYNRYFWVTNAIDETTSEHVLSVHMTEATSNSVLASMQAALPALVDTVTNKMPYTVVHAVPGIYYGIAGSTNLMDIAQSPQVPSTGWTVGLGNASGTRVEGQHPAWPSDQAFYRMKAAIVP